MRRRLSGDQVKMKRLKSVLLAAGLFVLPHAAMAGDDHDHQTVVTSIKPIHSLVSAVMQGVGTPYLLVKARNSPHSYSMTPSDAEALEHAKVVFWIGEDLERFMEKPLEALAGSAKKVALSTAHGITTLPFREGGPFEAHDDHGHDDHDDHAKAEHGHDDHDDHGHDDGHGHDDHDHDGQAKADDHDHDHDDHAKAEEHDHDHDHDDHAKAEEHDHDHDHDDHAKADHDDHGHDDHAHGEFDMHVWLDPANAKEMVHAIEEALSAADPANAATYKANAEKLEAELGALVTEVKAELAPVADRPFIVFHDAYQYFEKQFGLKAAGSITVSPEVIPGAGRIKEIQAKVGELGATCVFAEPQFDPKLVNVVTSGTSAKSGVLDPLGSLLDDGPDLYFGLIRGMADEIVGCLSPKS